MTTGFKMDKHPKRPRDPSQVAKFMIDIACAEPPQQPAQKIGPVAKRGHAGGVKAGRVRAQTLSPEERRDIARMGAMARWKKSD